MNDAYETRVNFWARGVPAGSLGEIKYYLRDKNGEPMMGYPDIYEGRQALNTMPPGTELVRAEDGVVVSVM